MGPITGLEGFLFKENQMSQYDQSIDYPEDLAAVNDMLAAIGEAAVNTLETDTNADVANARRILDNVNREVQSKGWSFNIRKSEELSPDAITGYIPYMQSYLRMQGAGGQMQYVKRGDYVWDTAARTDNFKSSITVDLTVLAPFNEMPECFRAYIVTKASRRFNMFFFGAPEIEGHLAEQEEQQYRAIMEYELDFGQFNMLDGDAFVGGLLTR
ncbi:tail tube protein A [Pseudomonas phage Stalingrad]|uniref:Tail tube protein A n=1 Tax=Pseudomonas phage Stalingrad TaxID=2762287 RepID=A0A7G8LJ48_9CAUD|nr:tail tube protein A [Pseudomonas phage Stalingrad]